MIKKLKSLREKKWAQILLIPFAFIYGWVIEMRNFCYHWRIFKTISFPVPIIAIGNITAGGTGKTPFTLFLLELLKSDFGRIVVISRGYGRESRGVRVVSDGQGAILRAVEGGDEPVMIARKCLNVPVIVAERRSKGIQTALEKFKPDLILLDDAFQHRQVARNCDIVLINQHYPLHQAHLLPRGNLREHVRNLSRADMVVITNSDGHPETTELKFLNRHFRGEIFTCRNHDDGLVDMWHKQTGDISHLAGEKAIVFAAIAEPEQFKNLLLAHDIAIADFLAFPDHHAYKKEDLADIYQRAKSRQCRYIITTEKDLVKIEKGVFQEINLVAVSLKISMPDMQKFRKYLLRYIDIN
ncbi:MAG: tetraacyldisaccharide 4'-kinase [Calditrichales bacterium]|nr:MAG: tetraacyldisaccharide 4'-kinase [Calditrichales bacterium]